MVLKAENRRCVHPFTCKEFRIEENRQTDVSRLLCADAFLGPIIRQQVKMENTISDLRNQISCIFENMQTVDLDEVLQEIISIDLEDNSDDLNSNEPQSNSSHTSTISTTSAIGSSNDVIGNQWHIDLTSDSANSHEEYDERFAAYFSAPQHSSNEIKIEQTDEKTVPDALSHQYQFEIDVCLGLL